MSPVFVFEDNTSTIAATQNPLTHPKLKHLDVIYHQISDFIKDQKVIVAHIDTQNQLADLLTKPHPPSRHHYRVIWWISIPTRCTCSLYILSKLVEGPITPIHSVKASYVTSHYMASILMALSPSHDACL